MTHWKYYIKKGYSLKILRICWVVFNRRQKELEEKLIEEEVARRVEELVAKRVEEELERRKDEIEAEVRRRVEEAKKIMEKQMLEELERQREAELEAQKKKEVMKSFSLSVRVVGVCSAFLFSESIRLKSLTR